MTSPHGAPEAVVATMVTTAFQDNPPADSNLTAKENTAESTNTIPALNSSVTIAEDRSQNTQVHEERTSQAETFPGGQSNNVAEAAIPQTPQMNEDEYSQYAQGTMTSQSQMAAIAAMIGYNPAALGMDLGTGSNGYMDGNGGGSVLPQQPFLGVSPGYLREADETRISAYALLEFPDGQFYMNTYSVILGRDLAAARAAMRRDAEEEKRRLAEESAPRDPKTPVRIKREESRYNKSVVSESGGFLREGDDSDPDERARRRKFRKASKKSKSTGSDSQRISRRNSLVQPNGKIDYQPQPQARRYVPDGASAAPVDPASLKPSPFDCPLIGIHPPATTAASGYKAISREHVKIAFNLKKNIFEAIIIGRNGAFVDDEFYYHNDVIPLKNGSLLQIGGVVVRFLLPDATVADNDTGYPIDGEDGLMDRYIEGGKEMSFDFESTPRNVALLVDTSDDELSDGQDPTGDIEEEEDEEDEDGEDGEGVENSGSGNADDDGEDDEGDDEEDEDGDDEDDGMDEPTAPTTIKLHLKRRGPGRPPKNGIMSKREQQLAKKEAQQILATKTDLQQPPSGKNKVGRPRKHPRPDTPPIKTEKRKYTKRKPKDPDAVIKQEGSGEEDKPTKEKKEKKASKPPRSPTPTFDEKDLTPEQIAKPQANYVTLIHEALSNSPTGQMSLPQIYRAIQRRYPFFVLKCTTNGWQSSVRHNLSQHHAFRKVERDGKGWMWAIVDGVSIEKEKKRRPTPPHQLPPGHMHHQPIYRAGPPPPHMMPPGMMGPPPGYPMHMPPNMRPPYPGQPMGGYPMPGHPGHPGLVNGPPPPGYPGPFPPPPPMVPQNGTYSSPYAPKPPPSLQPPPIIPLEQSQVAQGPPLQGLPQQPRPNNYPPPTQQMSDQVGRAIDAFKVNLIASLKGKSNNAEAVVASAVNRVLGIAIQSTVPGDPHEEKIMSALRNMLTKFPRSNQAPQSQQHQPIPQQPAAPRPTQAQSTPQPQTSTPQPNAGSPALKPSAPTPAIQRPSFMGNRPPTVSVSVPRPVMTPGMSRTNSGSPAPPKPVTSSASPIPTPSAVNGNAMSANMTRPAVSDNTVPVPRESMTPVTNENGKRTLDEGDDMAERDFKRLSTTTPSFLKA